eukprot:TRINITY_DN16526_c0_g1_i1.p1 TRINITY_DN16526_c0_g1~~TRINITY_DN16526_c0_g1_i1.p1  ORF type:complete len:348 (-),score=127.48 TRINITY_DN16526_c0_g1_i1:26-1069(-)
MTEVEELDSSQVKEMEGSDSEDYVSDSDRDTDEELKEAFAAGLIKPGLNLIGEAPATKEVKNNIPLMEQKLAELQTKLPWVERLDMSNDPAPIAPELAYKEEEHSRLRQKQLTNSKAKISVDEDVVHNDFKREMLFYRQAQSAVVEGIKRLQSLNIPTRRPDDFFAQMVKSDDHMQKIRQKLLTKQQEQERIDKVRKLRELKKYGKQVQVEVQQNRAKEKRQLMENVKKFRKGKLNDLDFLDNGMDEDGDGGGGGGDKRGNKGNMNGQRKFNGKRQFKNDKFGFGGKKRGLKRNTKESADDISDYKSPGNKGGKKGGNLKMKTKTGASKRFGKERRKKMMNKNKKRK